MKVFAGPFIGEFGWELCYWHAWLRKIKNAYFKNDEFIVASYPGRQLFYEFADKFVPLPSWFLEKGYSAIHYMVEDDSSGAYGSAAVRADLERLLEHYRREFGEETFYILNYPQRVLDRNTDLLTRIRRKISYWGPRNANTIENYLRTCNPHYGPLFEKPLFFAKQGELGTSPQRPNNKAQEWIRLSSTAEGRAIRDGLLKDFDRSRPIIPIFPRKRLLRRPDKNWEEEKWLALMDRLIKDMKAIVVLCGAPSGAFLADYADAANVINIIRSEARTRLDLQLAFLEASDVSIHGRSGSCYLSMQNGCPVFMAASDKEYKRICIDDNPTNAEIRLYTDHGVNPPVDACFDAFRAYYEKIMEKKGCVR